MSTINIDKFSQKNELLKRENKPLKEGKLLKKEKQTTL